MSSLANSSLDSLNFFENLTNRVPKYFKRAETITLNPKYQRIAKLEYDFADEKATVKKSKKDDEEEDNDGELNMNLDEVSGDADEDVDEVALAQRTAVFTVPTNFASVTELRSRLKTKISEQRKTELTQEEKTARRKKVEAKEKAQKKQLKDNQKKRKVELKARLKQEAEEKAAKKAKLDADSDGKIVQLSETEAGKVTTDPKNITANFTFARLAEDRTQKAIDRAIAPKKAGSKLQQLKKLEQFKEKVATLQDSGDNEAAEKLIRERAVETALARAAGEVVKDDENKLKKRIKKAEKKKEKSATKWKKNLDKLDKDKNERLDRRELHIKKKIEEKISKKRGTFVKKTSSSKGGKKPSKKFNKK